MLTTFNQSIECLQATGNVDMAWSIAKLDEGMNADCTKALWLQSARKAIARHADEAAIKFPAAYYS